MKTRIILWFRRHGRKCLIIKTSIMVGLIASYWLPPLHSGIVSGVVNLIWLWGDEV